MFPGGKTSIVEGLAMLHICISIKTFFSVGLNFTSLRVLGTDFLNFRILAKREF